MLQTDNQFFFAKIKKIVYSRNAHAQNSEVVHELELAIKYVIRLFAIMISISQSNHRIFKMTTNRNGPVHRKESVLFCNITSYKHIWYILHLTATKKGH